MKSNESCHVLHLAGNAWCDISLCRQCSVIYLRIGPVSLKLPPEAFQYVCEAIIETAKRFQDYLPLHPSEASTIGSGSNH
jgi:hypothetical protein